MLRLLALVILSFVTRSHAASDANALWQASEAKRVSVELQATAPSEPFKKTLLDRARADDRDFVKRMIIDWKNRNTGKAHAEFNLLILRDSKGEEILRMVPVENEVGKFRINGRIWSTPQRGSISRSLEQFLITIPAKKSASAMHPYSEFANLAFGEQAHAEIRRLRPINAAYLYASLLHARDTLPGNLWATLTSQPVEVKCPLGHATGRVKILNQIFNFDSSVDGSVTLMPANGDSSPAFRVSNEKGDLVYNACANAKCTEISNIKKTSVRAFIKFPKLDDVDVATTFRPRDGDPTIYPIEYACEDESECTLMEIRDLEKLSARDRKWAVEYRDRANHVLMSTKADGEEIIRALAPLASCCGQVDCSKIVTASRIQFVPNEDVRSGMGAFGTGAPTNR